MRLFGLSILSLLLLFSCTEEEEKKPEIYTQNVLDIQDVEDFLIQHV